ncbi:hypothetical protein KFL_000990210 [Klebsormidium nitens]|uniref:Uncharacterized protein n=1 Tax=Klebsormidium nitens TaxID=105231 RepID=A0A1Y1HYQ3_KLENI|nr:hypothetical protein KFL_000990210 [Klebsormidium nitens]|eukprot:GAQ82071.1 hypothetical protein KFL_000990210 [Klebsormidium nitens]
MFGGDDDFGDDVGISAPVSRKRPAEEDLDEEYETKKAHVADHATTTILNLRASLEQRDADLVVLQQKYATANAELERWRTAFKGNSILPGLAVAGGEPDPTVVIQEVLKMGVQHSRLREQLQVSKGKEDALLIKLTMKDKDVAELKTQLHDLKQLMHPKHTQARQLLLDPVLHLEFTKLKTELEASEKKLKEAQDDLAAVQFTPHSKNGKMLMAKCRTLQEENEEIGREMSEGKMHELENKLALQKQLNVEMKQGFKELQEYVDDLNDDCDKWQHVVYSLQKQLREKERALQKVQKQVEDMTRRLRSDAPQTQAIEGRPSERTDLKDSVKVET